jgi:hypothetical protein
MAEPVTCPACGLGLRGIPHGRRLLVTCPLKAGGCGTRFYHPPTERSTIAFRCSRDGSPFLITFKREAMQQQFVIDRIVRATGKGDDPAASQFGSYAADVYDVHHFYCPCCGYAPEYGSGQMFYVHCSKCRDLICGGCVYEKLDGPATTIKWFVCHPACGHQGPVWGTIGEYQATRSTSAARLAVPGLPTPDKPPPKQIG